MVETTPITTNGEVLLPIFYTNAPQHTDSFNGGWGQVLHFLTGGEENGARYDSNGDYIGPAYNQGGGLLEWVSVGAVKGSLALVKFSAKMRKLKKWLKQQK